MALRYLTAGESHGQSISAILDGLPAGLPLTPDLINLHLARRQKGYGRGKRMSIETDTVQILSGVRFGKTIGSPVQLLIENRDWKNWSEKMNRFEDKSDTTKKVSVPRPGHADFTGAVKYGFDDIRPVIERSSARETAARVAACTIARIFLKRFGIEIGSYVSSIGSIHETASPTQWLTHRAEALMQHADTSDVRMLTTSATEQAKTLIDTAKENGDTLGGIIEIFVTGLPIGLGSSMQHDRKLDGALSAALMSVQAVKGVAIGTAFENATKFGSEVHDELFLSDDGTPFRKTNRAGGLEGGMTNGEALHLRAAMKPISTLMKPLRSVDLEAHTETASHIERADVCAVPACSVICESVIAPVLANALLEKFGGDSMEEIMSRVKAYTTRC
jgi:chorismate synthase